MDDLLKLIKTTEFSFPVQVSDECKDLLWKMLVMKPGERLTIPEILNHPWTRPITDDESDKSDSKHTSSTPKEFLAEEI